MDKIVKIAIDGPSGAGKSTIAKKVAAYFGIDYIDTGAMYRAVAYKILQTGTELRDSAGLSNMLSDTDIDFLNGDIILDGKIISDKIRTSEVTKMASLCSAIKEVREKLVTLQRKMGKTKSIVMDGRDIGTNVLQDAELKIFMTADKRERAYRRWLELSEKGDKSTIEEVEKDIEERDQNDMTRALNPLRKAADAVELDTTGLSIEEVVQKIVNIIIKGE